MRHGGLSTAFLGMEDPQHHDQEPRGVPANLPELGLRSVERALHRHGDPLLPGARRGRGRPHHHRRDPCPPELAHGAACSCRSSSTTGRSSRCRKSRTRSTPKAASSRSSSGTRACGASPPSSRRPPTTPDETWYSVSPSQVPLGEFPGASTPKELDEDEIEELLEALRQRCGPRLRGGARRGRASSEPRLPALAVHLAALQQADRPLGRLAGEPPALSRSRH